MAIQSVSGAYTGPIAQPSPMRVLLRLKPYSGEAAKLSYVEDGTGAISMQDFAQVGGKATFFTDGNDTNKFKFNKVYGVDVMQHDVCDDIIGDNVEELLNGFNITIMAFGQAGTGKTYTMFGNDHEKGVVPKICQALFDQLEALHEDGTEVTITLTFFELFAESVHDLLAYPKTIKSLKTSSDPKTQSISIKGLRNVVVTSAKELQKYVEAGQGRRSSVNSQCKNSRSSAFIRITLEQRSRKQEIVKTSMLQLVDLASSDKLDKNGKVDISSDELKAINSSMQNLHHLVHSLADMKVAERDASATSKTSHAPHRSSRLTKLLQDAIGGNSKTTAVILCSTDKVDKEETVSSLTFGVKLKFIDNIIEQNKEGLNSKAVMDLAMKNMRIREDSYLTRIKYLEDEVKKLENLLGQNRSDVLMNKSLVEENAKLKDEVNLIRKSKENSAYQGQIQPGKDGEAQYDSSEILENLMEKCEKVIQLQLRLDEELHQKSSLSQQLRYKGSKAQALEAMNVKLLEQLNAYEKELKSVSNANSLLRQDVEKWSNVAAARSEKIEELEKEVQEHQLGTFPQKTRLVSAGELNHSKDDSKIKKSNWLFGNSNGNLWSTRKVSTVSTSSAITTNSQDSSSSRTSLRGLNLHAIRLPPSGDNENHADNEREAKEI